MSDPDPTALADEALRLVGTNPRRAQQTAVTAARLSRVARDASAESRAWRAHGMAARELGRLDEALTSLRTAIRRADRHDQKIAAAEARMSLAYVLLERGDSAAALAQADRAGAELTGLPAARLLMQRGVILHRCQRTAEAFESYSKALPVLRRHNDTMWAARCHNNRGLLHVYRGEMDAADADLRQALAMHREMGNDVFAADVEWNLGFLATRRGDVPEALRQYDSAMVTYRRHGGLTPEAMVTRGELLLSVGLRHEARLTADQVVEMAVASGSRSGLADALLLLAQAALATEDIEAARDAAHRALRLFTRQRRDGWATVARYIALRADERAAPPTRSLRTRALRVADELAGIGWRAHELDTRIIAARVALALGNVDTAHRELRQAGAARRRGPMELRIRAWYAEALLRLASGNDRGAESALRAGLRVIERRRATTGATELRVHMSGQGTELAAAGLKLARSAGSARKVFEWAERWRAGALRLRPVRPPDDAALAAALAELRGVSGEIEATSLNVTRATGRGGPPPRLVRLQQALEERVQQLVRRTQGSGLRAVSTEPPDLAELSEQLRDRVLVELVEHNGALLAVAVRDGQATLHELGRPDVVYRALESVRFALRRLAFAHGSAASLQAARHTVSSGAGRIDAELLVPLRDRLGDRRLVLVPTGALQAVPWSLLPSCAWRPVSVVPSAAVWSRAAREGHHGVPDRPGKIVLVCGPGLEGASHEIDALALAYPTATRLTGPDATVEAALSELDGADIAHIAAHGRVRSDNPLFSALDLADGPLTVYDLERMPGAPRLVLLPACQSGVSRVLAGDEVMGLTSALFALGTRTIVATVVPVPDESTHPLMVGLHAALRQGMAPADALAHAQVAVDPHDMAALATVAGFVCFGFG